MRQGVLADERAHQEASMAAWMAAARPHMQALGGMMLGGFSQGGVLEGKLAHAVPGLQARHQGQARPSSPLMLRLPPGIQRL